MPPFLRRGSIGDCRKIVRFSKRPVLPQTSTKGVVALSEVKHEQMLDARSNMPMWTVIGGSKSWCSKIEHSRNLICSICRYFGTHAQGPYKPLLACVGQFHSWTESSF